MIPPNLEEETVLRRTLEELESSMIRLPAPITPVSPCATDEDLQGTIVKLNEAISVVNTIVTTLNYVASNDG